MAGFTRQHVKLFSGLILIGLCASLAMSYQIYLLRAPDGQQEIDDFGAIYQIERTLSLLIDAETGQRGYLLTGDESYLEPYRAAVPQIGQQLERMTRMTGDDAAQKARIAELRLAIADKMRVSQEAIRLRREHGLDAALEVVRTNRGKQAMDLTRSLLATMRRAEVRRCVLQTSVQSGLSAFCVTTLIACLLIFLLPNSSRATLVGRDPS